MKSLIDRINKVGIYARLSREDLKKDTDRSKEKNTSESIDNQIEFITQYVLKKGANWKIIKIYIDDGYTGTNFDRPGFNTLMKDVKDGIINTIITKDLSRLGRNYSKTGYYIEELFPQLNVRYIAINDNIDTLNNNSNNEMIAFLSVFNDIYAKDISKKVRAAIKTKQLSGEYMCTSAPFRI